MRGSMGDQVRNICLCFSLNDILSPEGTKDKRLSFGYFKYLQQHHRRKLMSRANANVAVNFEWVNVKHFLMYLCILHSVSTGSTFEHLSIQRSLGPLKIW